jgi:thioesterase domain-containing protein
MTTAAALSETEAYLYAKIPITRAMGAKVESYDGGSLVMTAPLEVNHNHLGTAFGGSLAAVATLAGYALLWLKLGDRESHIVIRKSSTEYLRPVRKEIRAICHAPSDTAFRAFQTTFARAGKARLWLEVSVEEDGEVCMTYRGLYVALR